MFKSYLGNVTATPHKIILFELDFNAKFTLLRVSQFLGDLKSTILIHYSFILNIYLKYI